MPYELGETVAEADVIRDRTLELVNYLATLMDEHFFGQYYTTVTKADLEMTAAERSYRREKGTWTERDEATWNKKLQSGKTAQKEFLRAEFDNPLELSVTERDEMWMVLVATYLEIKDRAEELIDARSLPMLDDEPIDALRIIELRDEIYTLLDGAVQESTFDAGHVREEAFIGMMQAMAYVASIGLEPEDHRNYRLFKPLLDESVTLPTLANHYIGKARHHFAARARGNDDMELLP